MRFMVLLFGRSVLYLQLVILKRTRLRSGRVTHKNVKSRLPTCSCYQRFCDNLICSEYVTLLGNMLDLKFIIHIYMWCLHHSRGKHFVACHSQNSFCIHCKWHAKIRHKIPHHFQDGDSVFTFGTFWQHFDPSPWNLYDNDMFYQQTLCNA